MKGIVGDDDVSVSSTLLGWCKGDRNSTGHRESGVARRDRAGRTRTIIGLGEIAVAYNVANRDVVRTRILQRNLHGRTLSTNLLVPEV